MIRRLRRKEPHGEGQRRIPPAALILMGIGLMTVIYFMITYVLIPILAMMTTT